MAATVAFQAVSSFFFFSSSRASARWPTRAQGGSTSGGRGRDDFCDAPGAEAACEEPVFGSATLSGVLAGSVAVLAVLLAVRFQ